MLWILRNQLKHCSFLLQICMHRLFHTNYSLIFSRPKAMKKLATMYLDHSIEELGHVDQFIARLLDLGGTLRQEKVEQQPLIEDPVEYIRSDNKVSVEGIEFLRKCMESVKEDYTTFDMLKVYLKDEEDDMYWQEEQLALIDAIGAQNWLINKAI